MQVETKLKHAAIVTDRLDGSLGEAILDYAADCGLEVLDFYVSHSDEDLSSRAPQSVLSSRAPQGRGDLLARAEGLLRHSVPRNDSAPARNDGGNDIKVNFIDNSGSDPARNRLVSKIQALTKQDLDYESFVEALVPTPPDLIIVVGDRLANRIIEEASYAELVFVTEFKLDTVIEAFAEFARRKRNFGV